MKEIDKQTVDRARQTIWNNSIQELVCVIDRLDKQLQKLREAGEPFVGVCQHFIPQMHYKQDKDTCSFNWENHEVIIDKKGTALRGEHFRRLAEALKKE